MIIKNKNNMSMSRIDKIEKKINGVDKKIDAFKVSVLQNILFQKRRISVLEEENEKLKKIVETNLIISGILFISIVVILYMITSKLI